MTNETQFISTVPVLASLDIRRSVEFFCTHFGFSSLFEQQASYGVVCRDSVSIHFWACAERHIAENTSCRIRISGIEPLYAKCMEAGLVHPNAPLELKPWGSREFGILDPDGNLITFTQTVDG